MDHRTIDRHIFSRLERAPLSRREKDIALCLVSGLCFDEVRCALKLTGDRFRDHLRSIYSTLGVRNHRQVVPQAVSEIVYGVKRHHHF
jgi:DNA-binding CsgD family transcriptional regulator